MNERRYGILSLILALASLSIFTWPVTVVFMVEVFGVISNECVFYRSILLTYWIFFGCIPALVFAVVALKMTRHSKNGFLRIFSRMFSFLALCIALSWGLFTILSFLVSLLNRVLKP